MAFAEAEGQDKQPYKYNGKELDTDHGLNLYDYSARYYDPALPIFTTVDPHAESYPWMSPYVYCGNDPISNIDPDGMDYWSTSDPDEIARFLSSMKTAGKSIVTAYNYQSWDHTPDDVFLRGIPSNGLTYDDRTNSFHLTVGIQIPDKDSSSGYAYGVKRISLPTEGFKGASITQLGSTGYLLLKSDVLPQGGGLNNVYPEFALLTLGSRPGISLLKNIWNGITTSPDHTRNTITSGPTFRGGKQNKRDADINQYPTDFKRWYHKYYKGNQRGNATKSELKELYNDWLNMGKPTAK